MHSATLQPALIKRSPSVVSQHAAGGGSGGGSDAAAKQSGARCTAAGCTAAGDGAHEQLLSSWRAAAQAAVEERRC
eukprot:scaffold8629_cov35-Phaeocystis_antarctica.AAC.1